MVMFICSIRFFMFENFNASAGSAAMYPLRYIYFDIPLWLTSILQRYLFVTLIARTICTDLVFKLMVKSLP